MEDNNLDALFADWKQCMYCLPNDFSWNERSERVNCLWGGNVADLEEEEKFHTQNPCQYYWHIHNTSTNHDIVQFISQDTTVETLVLFSFNLNTDETFVNTADEKLGNIVTERKIVSVEN